MWQNIRKNIWEGAEFIRFRLRRPPIRNVSDLIGFVETRAVYVAQLSLYGYLKTRMGTSYREYFQDDTFSESIRISVVKVAYSCVSDLAIYSVAVLAGDGRLASDDSAALAVHLFEKSLAGAFRDADRAHLAEDPVEAFRARTALTDWQASRERDRAFGRSIADVIHFAPVIDEFKELDREIVRNSVWFRWIEVRDELTRRMDADAVARNWLSIAAEGEPPM